MSDNVITVENLSKVYHIGRREELPETFVGAMASWLQAPVRNFCRLRRLDTSRASAGRGQGATGDLLWALKDVSFAVKEGEVVGIIGRNGAGKSTLLKILSRITQPTSGQAVIRGRVCSLLEVGTGFHPELTGRENIYMNGTILGMTRREIDGTFDEIVDFSGVEKFLDTPIKRYSSGMQVRLAFAVAAHLQPEILVIDEVLAVGDAEFQRKCLGKMQAVASGGRTVLFVSHNMAAVEALCHHAIELQQGQLVNIGEVAEVMAHYRRHTFQQLAHRHVFQDCAYFKEATLLDAHGQSTRFVPLGGDFHLRLLIHSQTPVRHPKIGMGIDSITGQRMLTVHTPAKASAIASIEAMSEIHCHIPSLPLAPGEYALKLALSENQQELEALEAAVLFTVVDAEAFGEGRGFHRGVCVAPSTWWKERQACTTSPA